MGNYFCQNMSFGMVKELDVKKTVKVSGVSQLLRDLITKELQSDGNSVGYSEDVTTLHVCPNGKDYVLVEFAKDIPDDSVIGDNLKIHGTDLQVERWDAASESTEGSVSRIWSTDEALITPENGNTTTKTQGGNGNKKSFGKDARQEKINERRSGLSFDKGSKLIFSQTKVKLNEKFGDLKKMEKDPGFKKILDKNNVKIQKWKLTGTWNAIFAAGQNLLSYFSDSSSGGDGDKDGQGHPSALPGADPGVDQSPAASASAIDQSAASEQPSETFSVNPLFLRYIMAYHFDVLQNVENVSQEIRFKAISKKEKSFTAIARTGVDGATFTRAMDGFIYFYQKQNSKMHQDVVSKRSMKNMDIIQEARSKFSVVIDVVMEPNDVTIYGEKADVEKAVKLLKSKGGDLSADGRSSSKGADVGADGRSSNIGGDGRSSSKRGGHNDDDRSSKGASATVSTENHSCVLGQNVKLVVYKGDLTQENVDAIVNPANAQLQHGGGAAGAILKAGGETIQDECDNIMKSRGVRSLQPGAVEVTGSGKLPCKFVIHAVGPIWGRNPENITKSQLYTAVYDSLFLACQNGAKSISIPAISSGLYKVPVEVCALVLFDAVVNFTSSFSGISLEEIRFVNIDPSTNRTFAREMEKRFGDKTKREKMASHLTNNTKGHERATLNALSQVSFSKSDAGPDQKPVSVTVTYVAGAHNPTSGHDKNTGSSNSAGTNPGGAKHGTNPGGAKPGANPGGAKPGTNPGGAKPGTNPGGAKPGTNPGGAKPGANPGGATPPLSYSEAAAGKKSTKHDSKPGADAKTSRKDDECSICLSEFTKKKTLDKCGHSFCTNCIAQAFAIKKQCPLCSMVYGPLTGNQPKGNLYPSYQSTSLPGFGSCGSIVISYRFPSGKQGPEHPNPGRSYQGTSRTAYLPDNKEGRKVLRLLRKAFEQKLTFTIGRSSTTGAEGVITWNDIHHKTAMTGGPSCFGYPDPDYLKRVQEELAAKGITE